MINLKTWKEGIQLYNVRMVQIRLNLDFPNHLNHQFPINLEFVHSFQSEQMSRFILSKIPAKFTLRWKPRSIFQNPVCDRLKIRICWHRKVTFQGFDLGERGGSGNTLIEFGFVQKNHLENFVVRLKSRFIRFFLQ
jgi:hypothetical protein